MANPPLGQRRLTRGYTTGIKRFFDTVLNFYTELQNVNEFAKSFHGKPMDPGQFCAKSAGLIHAEAALIAYMEKNKDWCSFPDEAISQLKTNHAKNASFNAKACSVAAKIKQMKEQAAQGGGPQAQPLPTGPL